MHRSGFVTIVGKPNVGKSTFLNRVLGQKIAITSSKPQTTRTALRGIYNDPDTQIVFIDTPGVHKPKHRLGKIMTETALKTLNAVDLILYMINAVEPVDDNDATIVDGLEKTKTPVLLIVNKIDLAEDIQRLETLINKYKAMFDFAAVFAISALEGIHTKRLLDDLKSLLPEGPKYYPDDMVTDHPETFLIAEMIREKVLHHTKEEVPHSVAVVIDYMNPSKDRTNMMDIHATVVVERPSQKGIIIGKGGAMIKRIGTEARKDILALLGMKVFLDLHCKVVKNWRNKAYELRHFGYKDAVE